MNLNPLTWLYGRRKISNDDLLLAQCLPLMHKRLFLQGKSSNAEIDVLFELFYRLIGIASFSNNEKIRQISREAQQALIGTCATAADKQLLTLNPSTDQKKAICAALDLLAQIAPQLTNETYFKSNAFATEALHNFVSKPAN